MLIAYCVVVGVIIIIGVVGVDVDVVSSCTFGVVIVVCDVVGVGVVVDDCIIVVIYVGMYAVCAVLYYCTA